LNFVERKLKEVEGKLNFVGRKLKEVERKLKEVEFCWKTLHYAVLKR